MRTLTRTLLTAGAMICAASFAHALPLIPNGDYVQWYSGYSYFNFAEQEFEYRRDIALPTNATGAFAPFNGSMMLLPSYGDGAGIDIPIAQLGVRSIAAGQPFEMVSLNGLVASGTLTMLPLVTINDKPNLFQTASIWGTCTINLTGFEATAGQCGITTGPVNDPRAPSGWWTGYGFVSSGDPARVPGPIIGAGLPGLAAAVLALLAYRRRRHCQL